MRTQAGKDPDKTLAACVWLWTRKPALCDAPGLIGPKFDTDVRIGQIDLSAAVRCKLDDARLTSRRVTTLQRLTRDYELALTALVVREIERGLTDVGTAVVLATERRVIAARFGGSRAAYRAALGRAGASVSVARGVLGDELRRHELQSRFRASGPSPSAIRRYAAANGQVLARPLTASPAPSWLPEGAGYVLASSAPAAIFTIPTGRTLRLRTIEGPITVRAIDDPAPLEVLPASVARPAIVRELRSEQRAGLYAEWTLRRQRGAESRLVCQRDRLPEIGVVSLSGFAPFLALHESVQSG
jgi:hypothetical protein